MLVTKLPEIAFPVASPARGRSSTGRLPRSINASVAGFKILPKQRCEDCVGNFPSMDIVTAAANLHNKPCTSQCPGRTERPLSCSGKRPSLQSATAKQNTTTANDTLQNVLSTMSYTKEAQRRWKSRK